MIHVDIEIFSHEQDPQNYLTKWDVACETKLEELQNSCGFGNFCYAWVNLKNSIH